MLGQMTEPAREKYWDVDTGDEVAAALAAEQAYINTIQGFPLECEEQVTANSFKVGRNVSQVVPASTWTQIGWNTDRWRLGNSGFNLSTYHGQINSEEGQAEPGIWAHQVQVAFEDYTGPIALRCMNQLVEVASFNANVSAVNFAHFVWVYLWDGTPNTLLTTEVLVSSPATLAPTEQVTWWSGTWLGGV